MSDQGTSGLRVLAPEDQAFIAQEAERIRQLRDGAHRDIIEIGQRLIAVKKRLPHGEFGPWLATEFQWTDRTARAFMQIAEKFGDKPEIASVLGRTALAALASDSVPVPVRESFIAKAEAGERVHVHDVRAAQKDPSRPSIETERKHQRFTVVSSKPADNAPQAGVPSPDEWKRWLEERSRPWQEDLARRDEEDFAREVAMPIQPQEGQSQERQELGDRVQTAASALLDVDPERFAQVVTPEDRAACVDLADRLYEWVERFLRALEDQEPA